MKDYYYLILVFFLWSTSSAVVVNFKHFLPPFYSASVVIAISSIVVTGFLAFFDKTKVTVLFTCGFKPWLKIIILSFFGFFLYPICYFYGLHSGRPLEANVINYFWPLATLIFGFILNVDKITLKKIASIMFGFFGVLVAASTIPILGGSQNALVWDIQYIPAYLIAACGALSFGLYSALRKKYFHSGDKYSQLDVRTRFVGFLWVSLSLHILINLFNFKDYNTYINHSIEIKGALFLFIYSVFNFSLAYFLWVYVEKLPNFHTSMMTFLIPPISAITLSLFNNIPLNFNSIFGLLLIVVGLSIYQDYQRYITPLMGFLISFNLFGLLRISFAGKSDLADFSISLSIAQIVIAVFSILASFILTRTIGLYREERNLFIEIEDRLVRIAYLSNLDHNLIIYLDKYMIYLLDNESKFDCFTLEESIIFEQQCLNYIDQIVQFFRDLHVSQESFRAFDIQIEDLREKSNLWRFLKGESLSEFEWLILGLLIFSSVCLIFISPGSNPWHNFSSVAINSCLVLLIFTIRDYDQRRPMQKLSFILTTQRVSNLAGLSPYLPHELILDTRVTKTVEKMVQKKLNKKNIRVKIGNLITEIDLKRTPEFYPMLSYFLGIIVLLLVSYIILK